MKKVKYVPERRSFFKHAAMLGGAFVLLPRKGGAAVGAMSADVRSGAGQKKGYRLTPHVRKYYETLGSPAAKAAIETKE